ncbi:MAG: hypothetical protein QOD41_4528 [Cryptosporangiaceae bacterium]|nr:hypothetical protein [Cryptosporangiaceae bacterium]
MTSAPATEDPAPASSSPPLRAWQRRALVAYLRAAPQDFLAVATPGAGKTTFALRVAAELLADRTVDALTVVAPTDHLKSQWAEAAAKVGIQLDPTFRNSEGATSRDFHGVVLTYAQVGMSPELHRRRTMTRRTLVILDEIHHAGDSRSWGDGVKSAFEPATRRLALTGTPFRSDANPIPFVTYEKDGAGLTRSKADSTYGYADALRDRVVRPVLFLAYSGEMSWRTSAGHELSARLGEPLTAEQTAHAWRTALDPSGDWMPQVLRAADARLTVVRAAGMPDAGGLVIATDHTTARAYAKLLKEITGRLPVIVLSDDKSASGKIAGFTDSEDRWMVAVRMVSEGVDIPRFAVGVYATSVNTPLFFAQAVGRFVRARRPGETASVFVPSVPVLLQHAAEMEVERDHVLDRPHREKLLDDDLLAEANRADDEDTEDGPRFTALNASAHLDQVIYDGASFGTGATPGTPEEEEYLGLPGLLAPEQVSALLQKRQSDQLAAQKRKAKADPSGPDVAPQRLSAFQHRSDLRRQLNTLVAAQHHRTGRAHGQIHAELRKLCGGPPSAQASIEELEERIATIRSW